MMTVAQLLAKTVDRLAAASDSPRLDAEVLLGWVLGLNRTELLTHAAAAIDAPLENFFSQVVATRRRGVPVAYITGRQPFLDFEVEVTPQTLIPRPFTETLVTTVLDELGQDKRVVADIGTGSGAIALAIARHAPNTRVIATDISVPALQVAAANARRLNLLRQIEWRTGSLLTPLRPDDQIDTIIANLPYLPARQTQERSLRYEPVIALTAGDDGLDFIIPLIQQLRRHPAITTVILELLPEQVDHVSHELRLGDWSYELVSDGQAIRGLIGRQK